MQPTSGFFRKQLIVFFLFLVQSLFATEFSFPFVENKGQLPINIQAKVNLPGGSLFIENGLFTYHFFDLQKLAAIHEVRANDKVIKTHAFQVVFKNCLAPKSIPGGIFGPIIRPELLENPKI